MNHYELLAIVSGKYAETESAALLQSIEEMIKKNASAFHYSQNLERRKLAYPIQHHSYGTYILMEFDCDAATLKTIDHELKHAKEIIRYTLLRLQKVGAPKELSSTQQAPAFVRPRSPIPEYIPVSPSPVIHKPFEQKPLEMQNTPVAATGTIKQASDIALAIDLDTAIHASEEEPKKDVDESKQKQKKVTYEELDKKLDEILNNTIL